MVDDTNPEAALRRAAERRVAAKAGFRVHATVFAVVNLGLFIINLVTDRGNWWFAWPMFGWGIGLLAHGLSVYAGNPAGREAAIRREMERLRGG